MKTDSTLAIAYPAHSNNYGWNDLTGSHHTGGRCGVKIEKITIHHMAGVLTAQQCGTIFQNPNRCGSAHYGIGNDGSIGQYVPENEIAWSDGNWSSNCRSITIEVSDEKAKYPYPVSSAAYDSLIKLVADIAKRNKLGSLVVGKTLTWHNMYSATACPGKWLEDHMEDLAKKANAINIPVADNEYIIKGYNVTRTTDSMVVFTTGDKAKTNKYGTEFRINNEGIVINSPEYYKGSMKLNGCWVVSGHGKASDWIKKNIRKGSKVNISNYKIKVVKY